MERREEIQEKANELYHSHTPYEATIAMAEWADQTMIEKASSWIATHLLVPGQDQILEEFKQAMKK